MNSYSLDICIWDFGLTNQDTLIQHLESKIVYEYKDFLYSIIHEQLFF